MPASPLRGQSQPICLHPPTETLWPLFAQGVGLVWGMKAEGVAGDIPRRRQKRPKGPADLKEAKA